MLLLLLVLTAMMLLTVHNFLQIVNMFKIAWAVMLNAVFHFYLDAVTGAVPLRQSGIVILNTNQTAMVSYYYFADCLLLAISS